MCEKCPGLSSALEPLTRGVALASVDAGLVPWGQGGGALADQECEQATKARGSTRGRSRLWDLWHKYHCPIIGTCLEVDDLRRLARKVGATMLNQAPTDFEVHVSFVAAAEEKNVLSIAVQKELERRYARSVKRFAAAKSSAALLELWQQALVEGEVQGAFWAVMTHGLADVAVRSRAYEDIHMLSHQIGAGLRADLAALAKARKELARVRKDSETEARQQARRMRAKLSEIGQLRERVAQLEGIEQGYEAMRERLRALEDDPERCVLRARVRALEQDNERQGRQLADAELRANALEAALGAAESEVVEITARLNEQVRAREALERLTGSGAEAADCMAQDGAPCCEGQCREGQCREGQCREGQCREGQDGVLDLDLAGRRILCVGGRSDLASRYRDLVRRCNGEMIRHDGGLEDSQQRLQAALASADAVICPADAVSHNAYSRTKRFCKRMGKPCVLVPRSSVGAFAEALTALADPPRQQALQGPVSLGGERLPGPSRAA